MEEYNKFRNKIDTLIRDAAKTVMPGTVSAVDEKMRTCTVKIGTVDYEDVRLYGLVKEGLKGFCFLPKAGSHVLTARIESSNELFIALFTEIDKVVLSIGENVEATIDEKTLCYKNDKVTLTVTDSKVELSATEIILNGGELGGLVKIGELQKNLDSLKTFVEAIHTAVPAGIAAVGAALAANGALGKQAYDSAMAGKTITIGDMENTKIKQ